ncbi:MAG: uracil-DNA glycosylase family protein [Tumebacillaceae bacterium]
MNDISIFNELAAGYRVPDLIEEESRFLFLLESPHVQELKFGAPVSGSSGISMTKHLFGEQFGKVAIGRLLKENIEAQQNNASLNKVGLINVCQIPMQVAAYQNEEIEERYRTFFTILEGIRTANNKNVYAKPEWNALQRLIVEQLRHRLEHLKEREMFIIPCGKFAQKFFRLADVTSGKWDVIDGVPHPSYNGWSKPQYATAVHRMIAEFTK